MERFNLVHKQWGHIPHELAECCVVWPTCSIEYTILSELIRAHEIALEPACIALLLEYSEPTSPRFPLCLTEIDTVTVKSTIGNFNVNLDENMEVLTLTLKDPAHLLASTVRVRCLPYHGDPLKNATRMGFDLAIKNTCDLRLQPLRWAVPLKGPGAPLIVFSDVFGKDTDINC